MSIDITSGIIYNTSVLEVAVAAQSDFIITYNVKDFSSVEKHFGIKVITPKEFLVKIDIL
jgi:predicted nucleic acid-binding protein